MLIDYYVSPLFGIKMKWQTEIVHVDFQKALSISKKGPYKLWNHHHEFIPMKMES
jgi:ligand-binding SRPBCC domain-containing protein